ncbi:hypothetical protein O6P43_013929 [Quillaja saponaria]|uniref:Uncharacterized protein n=1 Tax=Quillaja saponaria TaxID=32244 RepID=A0AAD7PR54_QUISA|nr:hypothetical protein O6P43_013929 [Quillaja saponaria]
MALKDKPMSVSKDKSISKDNRSPKKDAKSRVAITSWAQFLQVFDVSPSLLERTSEIPCIWMSCQLRMPCSLALLPMSMRFNCKLLCMPAIRRLWRTQNDEISALKQELEDTKDAFLDPRKDSKTAVVVFKDTEECPQMIYDKGATCYGRG